MRASLSGTFATVALVALGASSIGCSGGSAASPTTTPGQLSDAGTEAGFAVCPPGLDASFGDMVTRVFSTSSCGTDQMGNCHSTSGSMQTGNLLDFTVGDNGVYAELLGADGGGHTATNVSGDTVIERVVPGDAGASMLYVKLTLKTRNDLHYGAGMPLTAPGSICPEALDAVKTWIEQGAKR